MYRVKILLFKAGQPTYQGQATLEVRKIEELVDLHVKSEPEPEDADSIFYTRTRVEVSGRIWEELRIIKRKEEEALIHDTYQGIKLVPHSTKVRPVYVPFSEDVHYPDLWAITTKVGGVGYGGVMWMEVAGGPHYKPVKGEGEKVLRKNGLKLTIVIPQSLHPLNHSYTPGSYLPPVADTIDTLQAEANALRLKWETKEKATLSQIRKTKEDHTPKTANYSGRLTIAPNPNPSPKPHRRPNA